MREKCKQCGGTGSVTCVDCAGSGISDRVPFGPIACPSCHGDGRKACPQCRGD